MKLKYSDVIIIGAGPAGMSAAIYLKRAGIDCMVIEKETPGGKLNKTFRIENYPGYVDKEGTTLAFRMYSQLQDLDIDVKMEDVLNVKKGENITIITNKTEYNCKYVILASGRVPRKLEVDGIDKYIGKGVSYCAVCDGALYKNEDVVIVGGGNSAIETAIYLSNIAKNITIINRSNKLRAADKEQDDMFFKNNVNVLYNSLISEIIEENNKIVGIKLNDETIIPTRAIFVCMGDNINDGYFQNLNLRSSDLGLTVDNKMKTSMNNIYACGDVIDKSLYQVVTAVSEGAVAATSVINQIKNNE